MPLTTADIVYGMLLPTLAGAGVMAVLPMGLPTEVARRYTASCAALVGFLIGYVMLSLGPSVPTGHWHWLVYLLIAAAIVGPISLAEGLRVWERILLWLLLAAVTAGLLVPTWEDLEPSRAVHWVVLAGMFVLLATFLQPLEDRLAGWHLGIAMWATLCTAAVVLALSGNGRFGQIAIAGAGAILGLSALSGLARGEQPLLGSSGLFAMLVVGTLLVGRVNSFSDVPLASYLLVPFAPLTLWCTQAPPFSRLGKATRVALAIALPTLILGLAAGLAVKAELMGADGY